MAGGASVEVYLKLNSSQFTKGLNEAKASLNSFSKQTKTTFNGLQNPIKNVNNQINETKRRVNELSNNMRKVDTSANSTFSNLKSKVLDVQNKFGDFKTKLVDTFTTLRNHNQGAIRDLDRMGTEGKTSGDEIAQGANKAKGAVDGLDSSAEKAAHSFGILKTIFTMTIGNFANNMLSKTIENTMASVNASANLSYFGKRMKMNSKELQNFNNYLGDTQKQFRKVDMKAVGASALEMGTKMKLSKNDMKDLTQMTAVMSSAFVKEGRSQTDAILAVSDAMDGQYKRLQEIGISEDELIKKYNNGKKLETAEQRLQAINKALKDKGFVKTAQDIVTLEDATQALEVAGGQLLSKFLIPLTPNLLNLTDVVLNTVDVFSGFIDGIGNAWNSLPDWAKGALEIGGVTTAVGLLAQALSIKYLDSIKNVIPATKAFFDLFTGGLGPYVLIIAAIAIAVYEVGKAFGWWTDVSSMIDAITAGLKRLWRAFIHNPNVVGTIKTIGGLFNWLGEQLGPVGREARKLWNKLFPKNQEFDVVRLIIDLFGNGLGEALTIVGVVIATKTLPRIIRLFSWLKKTSVITKFSDAIKKLGERLGWLDSAGGAGTETGAGKDNSGKGNNKGRFGGFKEGLQGLGKNLGSIAKYAVSAIAGITAAMAVLGVVIAELWLVGKEWEYMKPQAEKGIDALQTVGPLVLLLAVPMLAITYAFQRWENLHIDNKTVLQTAKAMAVAVLLVTEAIVLMEGPLLALALLGATYTSLKGSIDKGIEVLSGFGVYIYPLAAAMFVFAYALKDFQGMGTIMNGAKNIAEGMAVGMLLVSEAIILLNAPLLAIASIGYVANWAGDNVTQGAETLRMMGNLLQELAPTVGLFIIGITILGSVIVLSGGTAGLIMAGGIAAGMLLVAEAIFMLNAPLVAIASLGYVVDNIGGLENVSKGAEAIKITGEALQLISNAMPSLLMVDVEVFAQAGLDKLNSLLTGSSGLDYLANTLIPQLVSFVNDFNTQTASLQSLDSGKITTLITVANQIPSIYNAVNKVTEAIGSKNVVQGAIDKAGDMANQATGNDLHGQLEELYRNVKEVMSFATKLGSITDGKNGGKGASAVTQAANAITQLDAQLNRMVSTVQSKASSLRNAGSQLGTALSQGVSSTKGAVRIAAAGLSDSIINGVKSKQPQLLTEGKAFGTKLVDGFKEKAKNLKTIASNECAHAITSLNNKEQSFYNAGAKLGSALTRGFKDKDGIDQHSPGKLARAAEKETIYAQNLVSNNISGMYDKGAELGNNFVQGFTNVDYSFDTGMTINDSMDLSMLEQQKAMMLNMQNQYGSINSQMQNQALSSNQSILGINQSTVDNTNLAYSNIGNNMQKSFNGMDNTATNTFNGIQTTNLNYLNNLKTNTESGLNQVNNSTKTNLNAMNNSTTQATTKMVNAWSYMKNKIIDAANHIQSKSYSKFSSLHHSISSFYNQLANAKFTAGGLPTGNSNLSNGRRLRIGRTNGNTGGRIRSRTPLSRVIKKPTINNSFGTNDSKKKSKDWLKLLDYPGKIPKYIAYHMALDEGCKDPQKCFFGVADTHINKIMNTAYPWNIGDPWFLGIQIPMNNKVEDFKDGKTKSINANNFESILRNILTARGFANPGTYEYYANSKRSNQQVWDQVRCNCYDGAEMIVEIGQMLGLGGSLVHGSWKGEGHMGAMVAGKLYDMTQFQKRGVFRGTPGVVFGSNEKSHSSKRVSGPNGSNSKKGDVTIFNVNNDFSNARIYGIDDLDNHIKETTKETFYELNSPDNAVGY